MAFADAIDQPGLKVAALSQYGLVLQLGSALEEGHRLNAEAVRVADNTGEPALRASARAPLAWCLFVLGRVRDAATIAAELAAIVGDNRSLGRQMAITSPYAWSRTFTACFSAFGARLDKGLEDMTQAVELCGEEGDFETQSWADRFWAVFADLAGVEPDAAMVHAMRSVEWADQAGGPWSRVFNREGLATCHCQRSEWAQAIDVADEALAIARSRRTLANIPLLLTLRSRAKLGRGDVTEAQSDAMDAVDAARGCGTRGYESLARLQLARTRLAKPSPGELESVRTDLDDILSSMEALGLRVVTPQVHVELAHVALEIGDATARERELNAADDLFVEVGAEGRASELGWLLRA
jgi:tetratricopeptide (TPR) repeat protein